MKKYFYIFFFLLRISMLSYSQTWSSCGRGFYYNPTGLFSDTISHKLYVSGFVTTVDGMQANSIASWDGVNWDTLGHGALGTYGSFLIRYKNKLYLQRNANIYAWDFITLRWDSIAGTNLGTGEINSACIDQNNDLILVGAFNRLGSMSVNNIVRFDGTNFYPIGNPNFCNYIKTVAVYHNEIYIGGNFGSDTIHCAIAKWNGSNWVGVNYGFRQGGPPEVVSLLVYHDRLYAAGAFYGTIDKYMPSIAAWDGIKWNSVGGIYNDIYPWGVVSSNMFEFKNKLYVAGSFNMAGGIAVNNMAIWNDTNWCAMNTVFESPIRLATTFKNTIYIAQHYKIDNDSVRLLGYYNGSNYFGNCGSPVGISEIKLSDNIKIYPNPTTSVLNIYDEQNELQNSTIEITNSIGQTVLQTSFINVVDVSSLSTGCYFINIITAQKQVLHSKFIKE